jgi:hypothetical protein
MYGQLDPQMAERLAFSAMCTLNPPRGNKVLCTKRALREAFLAVAHEAYEIGLLAEQEDQYAEFTRPGSPDRPAWMDIRLDDPNDLAKHHIRFQPVVLKSLLGAGYQCLGDLRWVSNRQLRNLYYVGIRTARQIRAIVLHFERNAEASAACPGPASADLAGTDH